MRRSRPMSKSPPPSIAGKTEPKSNTATNPDFTAFPCTKERRIIISLSTRSPAISIIGSSPLPSNPNGSKSPRSSLPKSKRSKSRSLHPPTQLFPKNLSPKSATSQQSKEAKSISPSPPPPPQKLFSKPNPNAGNSTLQTDFTLSPSPQRKISPPISFSKTKKAAPPEPETSASKFNPISPRPSKSLNRDKTPNQNRMPEFRSPRSQPTISDSPASHSKSRSREIASLQSKFLKTPANRSPKKRSEPPSISRNSKRGKEMSSFTF